MPRHLRLAMLTQPRERRQSGEKAKRLRGDGGVGTLSTPCRHSHEATLTPDHRDREGQ